MQIEDYIDYSQSPDILVKGTRIDISTIIMDYKEKGKSPEEITNSYLTINIEQVYGVLTYYWHNKDKIDAYLEERSKFFEELRKKQENDSISQALRIKLLKYKQDKKMGVVK